MRETGIVDHYCRFGTGRAQFDSAVSHRWNIGRFFAEKQRIMLTDMDISLFKEEKARKFLMDVMGIDTFHKFTREGKIEIKSGKYIYELTSHGTVTNKTTKQSYCIILAPGTPDRDDIPLLDLIAIKYSWLKHNVNIVEKVANKRNLSYSERNIQRHIQRYTAPQEYERGYARFVRH